MFIATRCNEKETDKYREYFLKLDKAKRGYVTLEQLTELLQEE